MLTDETDDKTYGFIEPGSIWSFLEQQSPRMFNVGENTNIGGAGANFSGS